MSFRGSKVVVSACQSARNQQVKGVCESACSESSIPTSSIPYHISHGMTMKPVRAQSTRESTGTASTDCSPDGKSIDNSSFLRRTLTYNKVFSKENTFLIAGSQLQKVFQDVYARVQGSVQRSPSPSKTHSLNPDAVIESQALKENTLKVEKKDATSNVISSQKEDRASGDAVVSSEKTVVLGEPSPSEKHDLERALTEKFISIQHFHGEEHLKEIKLEKGTVVIDELRHETMPIKSPQPKMLQVEPTERDRFYFFRNAGSVVVGSQEYITEVVRNLPSMMTSRRETSDAKEIGRAHV